jgi:alpha-1,6-mannosyltransferase
VNLAHARLLDHTPTSKRPLAHAVKVAIGLLTFATVVFRSELLLLLGPIVLQALLQGAVSFLDVVRIGLVAGLSSIGQSVATSRRLSTDMCQALTVSIDSYFWSQAMLWPELYGLYFNVYLNKSSEWGVSPPLTYITSFLPKMLLTAGPLAILGFSVDRRVRSFVAPSMVFVVFISALAHKEWRFIIYTIPVFNVAAARGAHAMFVVLHCLVILH